MVREIRGLSRPYGFRSSSDSVGGSVARAREANVSMIKFTHNICTALRGESCGKEATSHPNVGLETPPALNSWEETQLRVNVTGISFKRKWNKFDLPRKCDISIPAFP